MKVKKCTHILGQPFICLGCPVQVKSMCGKHQKDVLNKQVPRANQQSRVAHIEIERQNLCDCCCSSCPAPVEVDCGRKVICLPSHDFIRSSLIEEMWWVNDVTENAGRLGDEGGEWWWLLGRRWWADFKCVCVCVCVCVRQVGLCNNMTDQMSLLFMTSSANIQ